MFCNSSGTQVFLTFLFQSKSDSREKSDIHTKFTVYAQNSYS